jgi:hypothetical protein
MLSWLKYTRVCWKESIAKNRISHRPTRIYPVKWANAPPAEDLQGRRDPAFAIRLRRGKQQNFHGDIGGKVPCAMLADGAAGYKLWARLSTCHYNLLAYHFLSQIDAEKRPIN